ncbi:hypothetical protein GQR58_008555 [Nymphon striatum]|nr:hypothetical protein GQR58_008555 [Nymphon striatum]
MNSSSDQITMSTRQKIMSCTMIFAITLQGMVFTLFTSFFPQQAFTKNMTHADVGVIFASFPAATLVVSVFGASLGLVEMSFGLGGCLGALIGGSLFDVNIILHEEDTNNKSPALILLRIPELIFPFWVAAAGTTAQSFTEAFISPHLTDHFKITKTVAGCYLMVLGIGSTILSPVFGYILDKKGFHEHVLIIGSFIMGIGLLLLGPAPILGLMPSMSLAFSSIVIVGVCLPLLAVPITSASFNITKEFVGMLLGGVLINELDFARATFYMSVISFLGGRTKSRTPPYTAVLRRTPPRTTHTDNENAINTILINAGHHSEFFYTKYVNIEQTN